MARSSSRLACLVVAALLLTSAVTFVSPSASSRSLRGRVALRAEGESVALVKVTEENKITTASVIGGVVGLLVGGVWVGGALFAAGAYLARKKDDDVSKALQGLASTSLEVLNFTAYVNDKYTVTDKLGGAISEALESAKSTSTSGTSSEASQSITSFINGAVEAFKAADKDIDFKGTFGSLAMSASDLANQVIENAMDINDRYKLTDQLSEKIKEATDKAGSSAKASS